MAVKNKLDQLFASDKKDILNMYCTAGYPRLESTTEVMIALQQSGADIIELGIPYSDPIADGPVIQQSNMQALENGIHLQKIFDQLQSVKDQVHIPVILMGYLNPVLQYGIEKFCEAAANAGVAGVILPDMPMYEFEINYRKLFKKYNLHFIFLISPQTDDERIKKADKLSSGFLYAVSSSATTGKNTNFDGQLKYFKRIKKMKLNNPVLIGFGINSRETFTIACNFAAGAIIGSAYINALKNSDDIDAVTRDFISNIKAV